MQQTLFRKKALEKLSSPEQLDLLMQVTNPRGWLAFFALAAMAVTAVFWSIFGWIPTKIFGTGILIRTGGVYEVVSLGAGRVTEINVRPGDQIVRGQIIARVAQPEILDQIKTAQAELAALETQHATLSAYVEKDLRFQKDLLAEQKRNASETIVSAQERVKYFDERIQLEEGLLKKGLITAKQLLATKDDRSRKEGEITTAKSDLMEINVKELSLANQARQQITLSEQKITDHRRRIEVLQNQLELVSGVVTQNDGRVLEIRTDIGKIVDVGTPLISLESTNTKLEALFYVPPADGKKVHNGMEANVSPSTVKREEYGFIDAKVRYVSSFPATSQAMMRVLGNEALVQSLSASGAPFEVHADLLTDKNTESGFKWSSSSGPPVKIYSGTLCTGMVIVRKQRPITLLIPYVREKLGV